MVEDVETADIAKACQHLRNFGLSLNELTERFKAFAELMKDFPRIEYRRIWWFERTDYEAEGWLVRHPHGGFRFAFRPLAVRTSQPSQA